MNTFGFEGWLVPGDQKVRPRGARAVYFSIQEPPINYRTRNGGTGKIDPGDWSFPIRYSIEESTDTDTTHLRSKDWAGPMYVRIPKGKWGHFRWHLFSGLASGFPLLDVLYFSWRYRR